MRGHAVSHKRLMKAKKIEYLLGDLDGKRLLDLGTGSGLLAEYFASRGADVTAADRDDVLFNVGVPFVQIDGTALPFPDSSFDICIFNHVIEHVGPREKQEIILREICRILTPSGKLYIAVPNKWAVVEPHYKLPFLGAMPRGVADRLVQVFRESPEYDCFPPSPSDLHQMLNAVFVVKDMTNQAMDWYIKNELKIEIPAKIIPTNLIPRICLPTLISICTKPNE